MAIEAMGYFEVGTVWVCLGYRRMCMLLCVGGIYGIRLECKSLVIVLLDWLY